jgi:ubiquitin carboxyl-terminal hydrolase 5/13
MGFPEIRCQKALLATGNNDSSAAMEWLFNHMDDVGSSSFVFFKNLLS